MRTPAPLLRAWPVFLVAAILWFWPVPWSLWTDEFFSAGFATRELTGVIDGVAKDRHPPLFFLMVWLAGHLSTADNALRALSGLAMMGALVLTVDAARRHLSSRTSLAVGAWFAASAVPALFAHTLRMYGMVALAAAAMVWGALEASTPGAAPEEDARARRGRWVLAAGGIAAFWTHYAAVLVGVAAFTAAYAAVLLPGATSPRSRRLFPLVGASVAVIAGCLPWLLGPFREQFSERDPTGHFVWEVLVYLCWSPNEHLTPLSFVAAAVVFAGGVWLATRGPRAVALLARVFLVAMLVLPFVASANVPARLVRNYVGFFPVAALFAGAAVDALMSRLLRTRPALADRAGAAWAGAGVAALLTAPLTLTMLAEPVHPQDINTGHDYRLEARVLDEVIPADASVRFQPSYVVEQFARYAPALRDRVGKPKPSWQLLTSGGKAGSCLVLHAFRVRVQPPESACETTMAALSKAADETGYSGLLLDRAARHIQAGELDAAQGDLDRVLSRPQRWPVAWIVAAQVAEGRKDNAAALAAYTEALRLARAYEPPGKVTSSLWRKVAKLREVTGDVAGAATAKEAGDCAADREPAWACGGMLAWATRPAEDLSLDDEAGAEKPKVQAEPNPEPPPEAPPPAAEPAEPDPAEADGTAAVTVARPSEPSAPERPRARTAVAPSAPTSASPGETTSFASGLPTGWIAEGAVKPGGGGVVIGDGAGTVSSMCSPPWPVAGAEHGAVTRSAELAEGDAPTWTRLEARALGADKRALPGSKPENLGSKKVSQPLGDASFSWSPPPGAAAWRLCVKTGGAAKGTTTVLSVRHGAGG